MDLEGCPLRSDLRQMPDIPLKVAPGLTAPPQAMRAFASGKEGRHSAAKPMALPFSRQGDGNSVLSLIDQQGATVVASNHDRVTANFAEKEGARSLTTTLGMQAFVKLVDSQGE